MKKETDVRCEACRRQGQVGALIRVEASRMEESMGHRNYRCDKCGSEYKFIREEYRA